MEHPNNTNGIPPGCRFYPSDEQLLCYYLTHKNNGDHSFGFDVINEVDLYNYDPFDLPDTACFPFGRGGRKRHWYCYAARVLKERGMRRAGGGFWRRKGPARDVVGSSAGKIVLGTRKTLVYYLGDSPKNAVRTKWVMYEYAQNDQKLASFALCRVFVKSLHGNNISENALSSCGEESVATVRHVGIQHDYTIRSVFAETKKLDGCSIDHENEVLRFPMGQGNEPSERISGGQTIKSGYISDHSMVVDSLDAEQLTAILEENYIEMDDLVGTLSGIS